MNSTDKVNLVMKVDLKIWSEQYEKDYAKDTAGNFPIFIKDDAKHKEKSPCFSTMSKVLQKRGYLLKPEFVSIGIWKTRRQRMRYEANPSDKIKNITSRAMRASEDQEKVKILVKLNGVGIPVASTILTVIYPTKYCVIDYRTWRTIKWLEGKIDLSSYRGYSKFLDSYRNYGTLKSYLYFLKTVRKIAKESNMIPRQVEMALWKFDEKGGRRTGSWGGYGGRSWGRGR